MNNRILSAGIMILTLATHACGQDCGWSPLWNQGPTERYNPRMVYDSGRDVILLYGGFNPNHEFVPETWEWNGASWTMISDTGPAPDVIGGLAYDSKRGVTVALEKYNSLNPNSRTWEWDGQDWTVVAEHGPTIAKSTRMVYCERQGVVTLYGGSLSTETWQWDGLSWTKVADVGPPVIHDFGLAYDTKRDIVVLFGGTMLGSSVRSGETWEWDGNAWTQRPVAGPSPRGSFAMAYDAARSRTVLFGGHNTPNVLGDTWEWDGQSWSHVSDVGPSPRTSSEMVFDETRRELLLFGGGGAKISGDTWAWNGEDWEMRDSIGPTPRMGAATAYDDVNDKVLLFGGLDDNDEALNDTWIWDGRTWEGLNTPGPAKRSFHSLTYDSRRGVFVLFGGYLSERPGEELFYDDTWEFDGGAWTQVATTGPPARMLAALEFDGRRQVSVLVGGIEDYCSFNDVWEWDGTQWELKAWTSLPRYGAELTYQPNRGTTFLYSGGNNCGGLNDWDMWEWDGFSWNLLTVPWKPAPHYNGGECFDTKRNRVVRYGGLSVSHSRPIDEMWTWDGDDWLDLTSPINPGLRSYHSMVYDKKRDRMIAMFGLEQSTLEPRGDMWMWSCPCFADCDQSTGVGTLDIFDFLCFQSSFTNGDPYACDCDTSTGQGVCDIFDFICFQNAFVGGCD